jgi:hypothetical protein
MKYLIVCLLLLASDGLLAQLPTTSLYLMDVERNGKTIRILPPKLISKKSGYNNQPYFASDDKYLYFVSSKDTSNVEVMRVDLSKKRLKIQRVTKTEEAEYSPKLAIADDEFSCVRVEQDKTTQHLAIYSTKGKLKNIVEPDLKNIGYYEWINQNEFISFELPEPFYLVHHNISQQKADTIATNIGRTFYYQQAKSRLIFVDKSDTNKSLIKIYDSGQLRNIRRGKKATAIVVSETLQKEEDYCLMQDGSLLMGQNGILYIKKNPFKNIDAKWEKLHDFRNLGIAKFSRIAITRDNTKIAIVVFKESK